MRSDNYHINGNEVELFGRAYEQRLPVMLTGPTGCGKTRLVEYMGGSLGRPVVTISCHDDWSRPTPKSSSGCAKRPTV